MCMLAYTDKHWRRFWELTGQPERDKDPRFVSVSNRADNIDALYQLVGKSLAHENTEEWLQILQEAEIPAGPVNRLENLRSDTHLNAIGFFRPFDHPSEGNLEILDTPYRLDGDPLPVHRHQPRLGDARM